MLWFASIYSSQLSFLTLYSKVGGLVHSTYEDGKNEVREFIY